MTRHQAVIELSALDGTDGSQISGELGLGIGISGAFAGDGDGLPDLLFEGPIRSGSDPAPAHPSSAAIPTGSVVRIDAFGAETIVGSEFNDTLSGLDGDDYLYCEAGDDFAEGGLDDDVIFGGEGNDRLYGNKSIYENGGGRDLLYGEAGNDALYGDNRADTLVGGDGDDSLYGLAGPDTLEGEGGDDFFHALGGADLVSGGEGDDFAWGGGGADTLIGGAGKDTLFGFRGDDVLIGGPGRDALTGSFHGVDRFTYLSVQDSFEDPDRIRDLRSGDVIDLVAIDADINVDGDQSFTLAIAFTGVAGQLILRFETGRNGTLLQGDVDGDGVSDFNVVLRGGDYSDFTGFAL